MKVLYGVIFAFMVLGTVIIFAVACDARNFDHWEFALSWTMRLVGGAVAILAAFNLLLCSWSGAPLERVPPALLAFLAGVLLTGQHWSVGLALGGIGIALTARLWRSGNGQGPNPPSDEFGFKELPRN